MEICLTILLLFIMMIFAPNVRAEEITMPQNGTQQETSTVPNMLITPTNVDFSRCCASFEMSAEKLFYLAISAINANNFEIEEIQSKMGYILFRAVNKSFLVSVSKENDINSMIKITPADNIYFFPYGIVYNIFYYINLNKTEVLEKY